MAMRKHVQLLAAAVCISATASSAHLKQGSLSPKGGETVVVGQKVVISWVQTLGHDGKYDLYLSKNGGSSYSEFGTRWQGPTTDGDTVKYPWTVPNSPGATTQLRICQLAAGECTDADHILKSANFTIAPAGSGVVPFADAAAPTLEFDPASRTVMAAFALAAPGRVTLLALDAQGRVLANLYDGEMEAGSHAFSLFATRLRSVSGQVIFRLSFGDGAITRAVQLQ